MESKDIAKKIVRLRYTTAFIIGLTVGIGAEATTALEAEYIISAIPGILSVLFIVTSVISSLQFAMTKLSLKWSLWIPIVYDILTLPVIFILFFYKLYLYMIVFQLASEAVSSTLFLNRKNKITECIKEHYQMDKFFNLITSLFSFGNILGYSISYAMIKAGIAFETIWICDFVIWIVPTFPILFLENKLLKQLQCKR